MSQADLTMDQHSTGLTIGPAFSLPTKKLAMWLFIIADTMTFAACLVAYGFLRNGTANCFVLLSSSLTMLIGLRSARAGDKAGAVRWIMITAALGVAFALLHVREWLGLIGEGLSLFHNPWGTGLFGASFFSVTGLHLTHVTCGVIALIVVGMRYKGGRYNADDIEVLGLYWHFVDLVWMFVVPLVYLLNLAH